MDQLSISIRLGGRMLRNLDYTAYTRGMTRQGYLLSKLGAAMDDGKATIVLEEAPQNYVVRRRSSDDDESTAPTPPTPAPTPLFDKAGVPVPSSVPVAGGTPVEDGPL